MDDRDRKTLAKLRRQDAALRSPRATKFRSKKDYRRKPKHRGVQLSDDV